MSLFFSHYSLPGITLGYFKDVIGLLAAGRVGIVVDEAVIFIDNIAETLCLTLINRKISLLITRFQHKHFQFLFIF